MSPEYRAERSQNSEIAGIVLAAGLGTRLRPLTNLRPKPLCPVGNRALVDLAIDRVEGVTSSIAVNVHAGRALMEAHLAGRVHLSIEEQLLGRAGGVARLREWIDGRPALIANGDAWIGADARALVDGWDGERVRVLVVRHADPAPPDFEGRWRMASMYLLPSSVVDRLDRLPGGMVEAWSSHGPPELVVHDEPFFDCGTPADYLAANLHVSGGASVVGRGAVVEGTVERCVIWPGAVVHKDEHLIDAIRAGTDLTVQT